MESHFDDVGMLTAQKIWLLTIAHIGLIMVRFNGGSMATWQITIMMYWLVLIYSYLYNVDERLIICHCQLSLLVENNSRNDADNDGT